MENARIRMFLKTIARESNTLRLLRDDPVGDEAIARLLLAGVPLANRKTPLVGGASLT
jgi:hypothetical protein